MRTLRTAAVTRFTLLIAFMLTGYLPAPAHAQAEDPGIAPPSTAPTTARGRGGRGGAGPTSRRATRVVPMKDLTVASPDGQVKFTVLPNPERLTFTVTLGDTTILEPSPLDFRLDGHNLSTGVVAGMPETYTIDENYPWHGAHSTAVNKCNGVRVHYTHDLSITPYVLEIRAFNDGVAYRHVIPGDAATSRTPDEYSSFVIPAGSAVWRTSMDGHYESPYEKLDISSIQPGTWSGPPLTFQLPDNKGYGCITEADLVNYAGMGLEADGRRGFVIGLGHRQPLNYPYELRYGRENGKRLATPAHISGTITTPWRVVLAAKDLNALVNSDVIPNLCPPPAPKLFPQGMNTPWCAPGTAVWKYVDGGGPNDIPTMRRFSELGGKIGAKYHILEGFAYRNWSDQEIKDFVEFSKQQGVRVLFWRHSNQLRTPEAREEFFARLHRTGVAGAKIDFFDNEAKETVDLYEALQKKAAEYQCVLDFHGANKPTGQLRTYPNEMIREAVRGMEASRFTERARHHTTLPYTRYLAGPCDYTTMIFSAQRRADTTATHQIASLATLHSAMLTVAANPEAILANPAVDVIKSLPAVWDETRVLPESRIGELSAMARRTGDTWFLAVMNGPQPTTLSVPLAFLPEGPLKATYVRDTTDPANLILESATPTRSETIQLNFQPGGGFVARFSKP